MGFKLECPRCRAKGEKAALQVVSGVFQTRGVYLAEDGFSLTDAKNCDTSNEVVKCGNCNQVCLLAEITQE